MQTVRVKFIMARYPARTALLISVSFLSRASPAAGGDEKKADPGPAEHEPRDALVQFDKGWKDYTNEPNYGDPRWKFKMKTLVRLAKAGPSAVPFLEEAAKESSSWMPHSRAVAAEVLSILAGPAAVRDTLAAYDLNTMDTAEVGKVAPDFSLADASGRTYSLGQFRGKKTIVLTFIIQDI
jgi:hypothetical protein